MNQCLRSRVYGKGNKQHVRFMIELCGLNSVEADLLWLLHDGRSDGYIEDALSISKPTREALEEALAAKIGIGIFTCINKVMDMTEK